MTQQELPMEPKKKTIPERILDYLAQQTSPKTLYEIPYSATGASECTVSARLRELARVGKVTGEKRQGTNYKEWRIS